MGQIFWYYTRLLGNIVLVLCIYWDLAMLILFCDHQETEYESWDMESGVSWPILIQKNPEALWNNDIHTLQDRRNSVAILHFYESRAILLLLCVHKKNNSESQEIDILQLYQYSTRKISKPLWENNMHITHDWRNILWKLFL